MDAILYLPTTGEIVGRTSGDPASAAMKAQYLGAAILESADQTAVKVLPDGTLMQPVASLETRRAERLDQAAAYRDARKGAGFDAPAFGRVSTDPQQSMLRINSALAAAAAAMASKKAMPMTDFPLADGSKVNLTPAKAVTMGLGVMGMLDACDQAFGAIEARINAAADPAAIDITAGYPN